MLYQSLKLTNGLCILVSYVSSPETPITHCHWSVELLKFPSTSIRSIEYFEKWCPFLNGLVQCPPATLWLAQAKNSFFLFKIVFLINLFCPISHASKVILKILQTRLQQYVNCELPDVHDAFRKVKGTRDQLASICWIMEKAREFQKNVYFCFIDYAKAFDCVDHNKLENCEKDGNTRPPYLPPEKSVGKSRSNS